MITDEEKLPAFYFEKISTLIGHSRDSKSAAFDKIYNVVMQR